MRIESKWIIGPGGYKCPCCGPSRKEKSKARRYHRHVAKARLKTEALQEAI
jgi:hypothetical protein